MSKEEAKALTDYAKDIDRMLMDNTPWRRTGRERRSAALRRHIKPGEVVVILDGKESAKDPLWKNAVVRRE